MTTHSLPEKEYREFSRGAWQRSLQKKAPLKIQFEITYRCNIHCVHCYTDPFNTPAHLRRELTLEEILTLLDQMAEAGVLWVLLTGGEAMVHPQFKRIYQEAKQKGFIVSLYSNGTVLTEEMADFLATDPPFQLEVSCHGATAQTFEKITQVPGSFRLFEQGIRRALQRGLPLKIKTKAMTLNRGEIPEIKAFVERLGLDFHLYTKILPRLDGDLSSTAYRLSGEEIVELEYGSVPGADSSEQEICGASVELASQPGVSSPPDDRLFRCGCGGNTATVSPYGILRACTFTVWPAYDLKEIPFRKAFADLVETVRNARYTGDSPCRACTAYTLCGKNPAMALYEAGSVEAPVEHFCDVAFTRKRKLESFQA